MNEAPETTNAPEAEISLNPEALRVQYQTQAQEVLGRAVDFIRRQGSSNTKLVDIVAYKALKEAVAGFALISYELQLQSTLVRLQQRAEDPSPDSATLPTEPVQDGDPSPAVQG